MERLRLEISWASLWRVAVITALLVLIVTVRETVIILLLAILISSALDPMVERLEKWRIKLETETVTTMKEIEAINIRRVQEQWKRRPPIMLDKCEEELAKIKRIDSAKGRAEEQAAKRVAAQRAEKQARQRRAGLAYRESCKVSLLDRIS